MTYLFHRVGETLRDLIVQRRLNLVLRNVLKSRKNRVLDFRLHRDLHNSSRVPRKLGGNELENLLLSGEISGLLVRTSVLETLFWVTICETA